jgi:hypothetical protein
MQVRRFNSIIRVALAAGALCAASIAVAQTSTPPPAPTPQNAPVQSPASRMDIFLGYSYFSPHGSVHNSPVPIGSLSYQSLDYGGIGSVSYFMNRYFGLTAEYANHTLDSNDHFELAEGGAIFRYPMGNITPFVHGLAGAVRVGGPNYPGQPACTSNPCQPGTDILVEPYEWGPGLEAGGGVDYNMPFFHHHLALRLIQADYDYVHANFGAGNLAAGGNQVGGRVNVNAVQLSAGLVLKFGEIAPPPAVTYSCSVSPADVFPGDTITITGTADQLNPKKTATYNFTATGGTITGTGATVTLATANLAPGTYTVTGHVTEGSRAGQSADCSATYVVKEYEPPTISCSANPSTVAPGQSSTITAQAMSPQNRALTYSYSASAGTVSGTTSTATLDTTGAAPGAITVTCNTQDDRGKTASATTTVSVEAPAAPAVPHAQKLCSIQFDHDAKRPTRVDNEAKACLDEVALSLQQQSNATVVVVGEESAAPAEPKGRHHHAETNTERMAEQRAVNTKAYLTTEKGIDASRIEVRTGPMGSNQVENYMVPSGANLDTDFPGMQKFDESAVKPMARTAPARAEHHHHHHKAATKAAAAASTPQ